MVLAIRKAEKPALGMTLSKSEAKKAAEDAEAEEEGKCLVAEAAGHRCELPGNYPVFTVVMVIYTSVRRISIITLPPDFF